MRTPISGVLTTLACTAAVLVAPTTTSTAAASAMCDGKPATIVVPPAGQGEWATDPVEGTPGDDVIVGTDLPDTIDGAGGNDTICGLAGDDELFGGPGNDRIFGGLDLYSPDDDFWGDRIEPGPGDDHVDLGHDPQGQDLYSVDRGFWDQVSFRNAAGPVTVDLAAGTATGEGNDTIAPIVHAAGIEGSAHDDVLLGTEGPDWITAGGGDDTIVARGGGDLVHADGFSDHNLTGHTEPGDDVVDAGDGWDEVFAGHGNDVVDTGSGKDTVWAEDMRDGMVRGGEGRDYLAVGGRARILGGRHADVLVPGIESASDRVTVRGGHGRDVLGLDTSLAVAPHRSRLVVGNPRGTVRIPGKGVVVRFSSTPVFRPDSIAATIRLTWHGTRRADVLDLGMHDGRIRAFARGGNDRVLGGWGNDLLDGGPGRDRIDGSGGRDRCLRGERLSSCERRR